ncbi:hypothetical protein NE235_20455 [Actinoallomurus spadix]|uniref:Uncharacterized protein n=1 Tax=Actinoallomurus spadix TaxID=79912 RepID=A0ABN0WBV0_9ACTN|nr:hypothetical protein [Actinoallomurus spadix]MCO5988480.1 hypothetical protein [Actinoallomurus spadix]
MPFETAGTRPASASSASDGAHRVTPEDVAEIAATTDPVLRNLRITQAYHDLSIGMAALLGRENVSWCCFGTWASRTAGRFIRGEGIPRMIRLMEVFAQRVPARIQVVAPDLVARAVRQVGDNVAIGNRMVFQDLGLLYARLIQEYTGATGATAQDRALDRCVAALRPGPTEQGGQELLIAAVHGYHAAMRARGAAERAEHILLANLRIGLHEQIRLQEPIAQALLPVQVSPFTPPPLRMRLVRLWRAMATAHLMDVRMPAPDFQQTRRLIVQRLGADVGRATPVGVFPPDLAQLSSIELKALLYDLDRTPNAVLGSAADDWAELGNRMNFVADLFRVWQQTADLFQPPFSRDQAEAIRAGSLPPPAPPL